jgi:prolyl-tRNA synthetase
MNKIDGQEILMPALNPKENWVTTGRWDGLDVLFKLPGAGDKEYALAATHEEVVTPLLKKFVFSYKNFRIHFAKN